MNTPKIPNVVIHIPDDMSIETAASLVAVSMLEKGISVEFVAEFNRRIGECESRDEALSVIADWVAVESDAEESWGGVKGYALVNYFGKWYWGKNPSCVWVEPHGVYDLYPTPQSAIKEMEELKESGLYLGYMRVVEYETNSDGYWAHERGGVWWNLEKGYWALD